ncbi:MAG: U32 family peptidase [Eubacterium ventriosum]
MEFAHRYNVKVYVTANILAHNSDIEPVKAYFNDLKKVKPDALIIADPAIFTIAKGNASGYWNFISALRLTILTMEHTISGIHLVQRELCHARELSISEIKEIRESYSG